MIRAVKSTPVREVRIVHAQRRRLVVHQTDELGFVTADVFDRRQTRIICGYNEHSLEQVVEREDLACLEPQMGLMCTGSRWTDSDQIVEPSVLENHERRHDFCQTGG